jgi:hypothetical protein
VPPGRSACYASGYSHFLCPVCAPLPSVRRLAAYSTRYSRWAAPPSMRSRITAERFWTDQADAKRPSSKSDSIRSGLSIGRFSLLSNRLGGQAVRRIA